MLTRCEPVDKRFALAELVYGGVSCLFRWRRNRSGVATAAASTATARTAHPREASESLFLAGFVTLDSTPGPDTTIAGSCWADRPPGRRRRRGIGGASADRAERNESRSTAVPARVVTACPHRPGWRT